MTIYGHGDLMDDYARKDAQTGVEGAVERLSHYCDYTEDQAGLDLFRSAVLRAHDRHDMAPVNFNSLARLLDTITVLRARLQAREGGVS